MSCDHTSVTIAEVLTIVGWNVNSLRARLSLVQQYLAQFEPDVLCLQETRLADAAFPHDAFAKLGYTVAATGSGGRAGVAIASRLPFDETIVGVPGYPDRRISCRIGSTWIDTVYVPTRTAIGKSEFLDALRDDYAARFDERTELVLAGDFNLCFDARDYASPTMISAPDVHPNRPEDLAFRRLIDWGLVDCLRQHTDAPGHFTWFPMTTWAIRRNRGMRLDYVFATPPLAERLVDVTHDRAPREWPRPSDHLPVRARFELSS